MMGDVLIPDSGRGAGVFHVVDPLGEDGHETLCWAARRTDIQRLPLWRAAEEGHDRLCGQCQQIMRKRGRAAIAAGETDAATAAVERVRELREHGDD